MAAKNIDDTVLKILSSFDDIAEFSKKFKTLDSSDRVLIIYNILKKKNLFLKIHRLEKCDQKAEEKRKSGNQFYSLKNDHSAMKCYSESIALAKNSETLALAFGNRSAVSFKNKLYRECLQDIEYAFENGYPEHLHEKLNKRKQEAVEKLDESKTEEYFTELPKLEKKNAVLECAADCVEMKTSQTMGRYIVATRDIDPGEIIAIEKPFAVMLLQKYYLTHCYHCLKPSVNLIPCLECPLALFCSKSCREEAWQLCHKYECVILNTLFSIEDVTKLHLLALHVVICARNDFPRLINNEVQLIPGKYKSGVYDEIHYLVTNEEQRTINNIFYRATVAAIFLHLLESTSFFDNFNGIDRKKLRECAASLLLKHLQTVPCNMHQIVELQKLYTVNEIGEGAYSFGSLFNHSCASNTIHDYHGTTSVFRTLRPIKAGQQLCTNYGAHHALTKRAQRIEKLEQYCFNCNCEACANSWPTFAELCSSGVKPIFTSEFYSKLGNGDRKFAKEVIPSLVQNAKRLENTAPSESFLDNQECLKQCFAILGNKYSIFCD